MYMYNEYAGDELAGEGGDLKLACVLRRTKKERKGNIKKKNKECGFWKRRALLF